MNKKIPNILLVGKSNVGKSTLFNTIIGKKEAIVGKEFALTRDYQETVCKIQNLTFSLTDTAGISLKTDKYKKIQIAQILSKIKKADLLLFITDGSKSLTNEDKFCCETFRKSGKKVFVVENKAELKESTSFKNQGYQFGFGEPIRITAKSKACLDIIYTKLIEIFKNEKLSLKNNNENKEIRIAIAGKPNTGKSSLLNLLYGSKRVITGPEAGTTRDSITTKIKYDNFNLLLTDTAGIKKSAKLNTEVDKASIYFSRKEIRYANIVFLIFDSTLAISNQDLNIANYIIKEGRAILLIFNKWDLIANKKQKKEYILRSLDKVFFDVKGVNTIFISALELIYKKKVFEKIIDIYNNWNKKITTSTLNTWLQKEYKDSINQTFRGSLKLRYIKQIKTRPPTFTLFYNNKEKVNNTNKRYVTNKLRDKFGFYGTPIRIVLKSSINPFKRNS